MNKPESPLDFPTAPNTVPAVFSDVVRFGTSTWTYEGWQGQVYKRPYAKTAFTRECLGEFCQYLYKGQPLFRTAGNDSTDRFLNILKCVSSVPRLRLGHGGWHTDSLLPRLPAGLPHVQPSDIDMGLHHGGIQPEGFLIGSARCVLRMFLSSTPPTTLHHGGFPLREAVAAAGGQAGSGGRRAGLEIQHCGVRLQRPSLNYRWVLHPR